MIKIKNENHNLGAYKIQCIFVFHIMNNIKSFDENPIYALHFNCLSHFSFLFDRCTIIITVDDLNNPLVNAAKHKFSIMFINSDLQIIVEKNDSLQREGKYYNKYIIEKLVNYNDYEHDDNELTFFGHTKGVQNYVNGHDVSLWVASMYYFCLSFFDYVDNFIIHNDKLCWGFPCDNYNEIRYAGSFQVFSFKKIHQYIEKNNIDVYHKLLDNTVFSNIRWCAETFLPYVIEKQYFAYPYSDRLKPINFGFGDKSYDYYNGDDYHTLMQHYLPYTIYNELMVFYENICNTQ